MESNFARLEKKYTHDIHFLFSTTMYLSKELFLKKHLFYFFSKKTINLFATADFDTYRARRTVRVQP